MSLFVLAVGVVMSLIGVVLLATGYPVIEVERGWASVISGATLVSGGIVTVAIGLLLRAVGLLRTALLDGRAAAPTTVSALAPRAEPAIADLPAVQEVALAPSHHPAVVSQPTQELPELLPESGAPDVPHAAEPHPEPAASLEVMPPPRAAHPPEPEPVAVAAPEPEIEATTAPTEADWLDRSFAELDRENAELAAHAPTEPALPPEPHTQSVQEEPQPAAAESVRAAEPTSAIIGRYEADGTSYVMYADGSIEAASPAGVYRFASMAELKSFIEG